METTTVQAPVEAAAQEMIAAVENKTAEVVAEIKKEVVAVRVDLTDAEKLLVRTIENEYLKAQMELQRLSTVAQNASKQFTNTVEGYVKKYAIDPTVHVFDTVELVFKKKN